MQIEIVTKHNFTSISLVKFRKLANIKCCKDIGVYRIMEPLIQV